MQKTFVVAVDPSDSAACAARCAAELAEQLGARVILLHVINLNAIVTPEAAYSVPTAVADATRRAGSLLSEIRKRFAPGLAVETSVLEGDPAEAIVQAAEDLRADLVFLGSDSRGRLAQFLLGSTADAVIRRASCPVVTVRRDARWLRTSSDPTATAVGAPA